MKARDTLMLAFHVGERTPANALAGFQLSVETITSANISSIPPTGLIGVAPPVLHHSSCVARANYFEIFAACRYLHWVCHHCIHATAIWFSQKSNFFSAKNRNNTDHKYRSTYTKRIEEREMKHPQIPTINWTKTIRAGLIAAVVAAICVVSAPAQASYAVSWGGCSGNCAGRYQPPPCDPSAQTCPSASVSNTSNATGNVAAPLGRTTKLISKSKAPVITPALFVYQEKHRVKNLAQANDTPTPATAARSSRWSPRL